MAFLLVLVLCAFWGLLGWSLLVWAGGRRNVLRSLMLAPSVGVAAVVVLLFELYRLGLPVRLAGPLITVLIFGGLAWWCPALPPRRAAAWLAIALTLAAAFAGAPLLVDSFNWVSFCNDDMANYVLGAQGLLARGYLNGYPADAFIANTDASLQLSAVMEAAGLRCGAELLLAWVMSLTGMADHRVFMPVIIALHLALLSAAAGLVCTDRRRRPAAWLVLAWLAVAALPALGAVYQLIAQVLGLGLLAAAAAVLLDPARQTRRTAVLSGLLAGALGVSYPEVFPFLGLGVLFCYGRHLLASMRWLAGVGGVVLLVWNVHCAGVLSNFLVQLSTGVRGTSAVMFPYYLIPSGLPTFWGLIPIAGRVGHPWIDIAIAAGALLLLLAAGAIVHQYRRGEPVGALASGFALLAVWLVFRRVDFGAYKVAMYLWPFAAGAIVLTITERRRLLLPLAVLILAGVPTSWRYIATSAGWPGAASGFVEIPQATHARLLDQLRTLAAESREHVVVADTYNIVLAKFAGAYFHGASFRTPAKDFFATSGKYTWNRFVNWYAELRHPGFIERFREMLARRAAWFSAASFPLAAGGANRFAIEQPPAIHALPARYTLIRSGRDLTVLNRSALPAPPPFLSLQPAAQVRNHLLLIESEFGRNYYLAESARAQGRVALFQLEPDYFRPGHTMAAAGRHLLFEILGPVPDSRLRIELSASLKADGENRVPPASVVGSFHHPLSAVGRGSARLLSASLAPLLIRGHHYLGIDMGFDPTPFSEARTGLLAWFGRDIPLDGRKIVGFVRDISLVTAAGAPPSQLLDFVAGLRNPNLVYSGSYEDGWVAEESFYQLLQPDGPTELLLRLDVPDVAGRAQSLTVRLDDSTLSPASLRPGRQELRLPVPAQPGSRRVHLQFDRAVALSANDRRPASALVKSLGLVRSAQREIPLSGVSLGGGWHPFEEFGGNVFRWVERDAEVIVTAARPGSGELTLEMEAGPGVGSKAFTLRILDEDQRSVSLISHGGHDRYKAGFSVRGGRNVFRLRPVGGGRRILKDPRILNFRVFGIDWNPRP